MINLAGSGNGIFEVAKCGAITSNNKLTIYNPPNSACSIIVSGGKMGNTAKDGVAARTNAKNARVTVSSGELTAVGGI